MKIEWHCKHFTELTAEEFHNLVQLRINVFVVEQNCPYPELDNKDQDAFHLFGTDEQNKTVAVARILKQGTSYGEVSIGRVATAKEVRMTGIGIELMQVTITKIKELFNTGLIRISAQEYLKNYYEKFGFVQVSDPYLEDDIPHIEMLRGTHS